MAAQLSRSAPFGGAQGNLAPIAKWNDLKSRYRQRVTAGSTLHSAIMKFISFRHKDKIAAGMIVAEGVLDLAAAGRAAGESTDLSSVLAIIRGDAEALACCRRLAERPAASGDALLPATQVQKLAPRSVINLLKLAFRLATLPLADPVAAPVGAVVLGSPSSVLIRDSSLLRAPP